MAKHSYDSKSVCLLCPLSLLQTFWNIPPPPSPSRLPRLPFSLFSSFQDVTRRVLWLSRPVARAELARTRDICRSTGPVPAIANVSWIVTQAVCRARARCLRWWTSDTRHERALAADHTALSTYSTLPHVPRATCESTCRPYSGHGQ
ncbi:hypothetical protein BaRGS_00027641 [Batillaria attramentaria]|uniref:Uncharacterized protein n=1 Tax=Batillaria attramentaria TaxID=370345 RepID=A0ABD0K1A3_9CAEN